MYAKYLICSFIFVFLSACASTRPVFKLAKEEDSFELRSEGSILISEIHSVSGIGGAELSWPKNSELISDVQINLHVQQLEFMRVTTSDEQWIFSLPQNERYPTPWSTRTRANVSSNWQSWDPYSGEEGFRVTRILEGVEVLLPAIWFVGEGSVQLEWIDWHR